MITLDGKEIGGLLECRRVTTKISALRRDSSELILCICLLCVAFLKQ